MVKYLKFKKTIANRIAESTLRKFDEKYRRIDATLIGEIFLECIRSNDLDLFQQILSSLIMNSSKVSLAKKSGLSRQTLYDLMDRNHAFNPELATVASHYSRIRET